LREYSLYDLHYDPNGSFFFDAFVDGMGLDSMGAVFQYTISTDEIKRVDLPHEKFFSVRLIDGAGNLWLNDAYAWRTPEGDWQTFHPAPYKYWWYQEIRQYWRYYSPPDPFLESFDGRIWFRIDRSNDGKNLRTGIAWFDPNTKEGCWFTSESARILEDLQHNLWMVVNGELYKYELIP
jgi:hypothetical protein